MRCSAIEKKLNAYLDGELDELKRSMVETHIKECADCREKLAELQGIAVGIDFSMPESPMPEGFEAKVMTAAKRMQQESADKPAYMPQDARHLTPAARFAAAAMVAIGLGTGALMGSDLARDQAVPTGPAPREIYGLDYLEGSLASAYLSLGDFNNDGRNSHD